MSLLLYKKYSFYISSLLFSFLFLIICIFGAWFLFGKIKEESQLFGTLVNNQKADEKKIAELPKVRRQIEWAKQYENELDIFESEENSVNIIKFIEGIGLETENTVNVSVKNPKQGLFKNDVSDDIEKMFPKDLKNTRLAVHIEGEYGNILKFLRKLENLSTFVYVSSIQIGYVEDQNRIHGIFSEQNSSNDIKSNEEKVPSKKFADISIVFFTR